MTHDLLLSILFLFTLINAKTYPYHRLDPHYYVSEHFRTVRFEKAFTDFWSSEHREIDHGVVKIWFEDYGSGFKSQKSYDSGYFSADIKLSNQTYTAGLDTSFYLSSMDNCSREHDEIDIEFLGHTIGQPYVVQTNVFIKGYSGQTNSIGREMKFHLWFDPSEKFHNYAIFWDPNRIIFFVDDVPIRIYKKKTDDTPFPQGPMMIYGSIWDASDWATDKGESKINLNYQPFDALYKKFRISDCGANNQNCLSVFLNGFELSDTQQSAMEWVQKNPNIMFYNYCNDTTRTDSTPECYM